MSADAEDYYYNVHFKSRTVSFWEVCHTLDDVHSFLVDRADCLSGVEVTIQQAYGWDEQERKELARLKAKYEPESKDS
jgi:hypothetical protein